MSWISLSELPRNNAATGVTVTLYPPEQGQVRLSGMALAAMGSPARVEVLFDPAARRIGFRAAVETAGTFASAPRNYRGANPAYAARPMKQRANTVPVHCAEKLRRAFREHGLIWPAQCITLTLVEDDGIWAAEVPEA